MAAALRSLSRQVSLTLAGVLWFAPAWSAEGLALPEGATAWPRWQARLSLPSGPAAFGPSRAALLGDYDLGNFGLKPPYTSGRFRATSGVLFDLQPASGGSTAGLAARTLGSINDSTLPTAPYLGLGYTGWLAKTGISFSADIGLLADYPGGSWRFGRALFGNQGFDATLREVRLQPRLQLGVQYSY